MRSAGARVAGTFLLGALLLGTALALAPASGFAKDKPEKKEAPVEVPEKLTPEEADALLGRLTDAQARALLARQLHKQAEMQAAAQTTEESSLPMLLMRLRQGFEGTGDDAGRRGRILAEGLRQLPEALASGFGKITGGKGAGGLLIQLVAFAAIVAAGLVARRALGRALLEPLLRALPAQGAGFGTRLGAALQRLLIELLSLAAFALVVLGLAHLVTAPGAAERTLQVALATGAILVYGAVVASRFLLSPEAASLRPLAVSDATASYLHRWIVRVAVVWVFALLVAGLLIETGIPAEVKTLIGLVSGALVSVMLLGMILDAREVVSAAIRAGAAQGSGCGTWRATFAATWHFFAAAYLLLVYLLWAAGTIDHGRAPVGAALASLGAVLAYPLLDRWIGRGIDDLFSSGTGEALVQRPEYAVVLHKVMRVLLVLMLLAGVFELWGFRFLGEAGTKMRQAVLEASFDLLAAVALAAVGWHFVKVGIDRRLQARTVNGVVIKPPPRLQTLLPLARKFILAVLAVMTIMLVLSGLGVNIGPLLAGAGVLGLAIGFGAQTLVKDILTGVFFLMDDAFRIGEYIQSGTYKGTVEAFGMRSVKLRHHRGPVFTVPFGELKAIQNMSRDWVIDKFNIGITYDSDIDKAKKLIKQIGKELAADPEYGPKFIEPLKMQGVEKFGDFAVEIRVKMMTHPNQQFGIRRKAFAMIKKAFDANGVKFAYPTVQVAGGGDVAAAVARQGLELTKPETPGG
jgi:small-conductance mechanosensitive channel